ncbi:MAG: hypothetical protein KatS3mg077_0819 [Candidatus Binatia bacterium]|nr:MAG: hypothetical protein KatS3mg077_0819 [Candidatus Binatia bacterium]
MRWLWPRTHLDWRRRWWRRVASWWALLGMLLAVDRFGPVRPASRPDVAPAARAGSAGCASWSEQILRVIIEAGGSRVVVEKHGQGWRRGTEAVPRDLVRAFAETLAPCTPWPVVTEEPSRWAEFGVAEPRVVVLLEDAQGRQLHRVAFGRPNPTGTGRYARMDGAVQVALAGAQAWYYAELLAGRPLDKDP